MSSYKLPEDVPSQWIERVNTALQNAAFRLDQLEADNKALLDYMRLTFVTVPAKPAKRILEAKVEINGVWQ